VNVVALQVAPVKGGLRELVQRRGRDRLCLGVIAEVERPGRVALGDAVRQLPVTAQVP
jgi:hypothetical protein